MREFNERFPLILITLVVWFFGSLLFGVGLAMLLFDNPNMGKPWFFIVMFGGFGGLILVQGVIFVFQMIRQILVWRYLWAKGTKGVGTIVQRRKTSVKLRHVALENVSIMVDHQRFEVRDVHPGLLDNNAAGGRNRIWVLYDAERGLLIPSERAF